MIHELVDKTDPILKAKLEKFDFTNPPTDPVELAKDLAETMIQNRGLGLAANQIGLPYRAFAVNAEQILVMFNPIVVDSTKEEVYIEEGCLSFPGFYVKVKRPAEIRVRFTLPNGEVTTRQFKGITARIIQHEMDHLEGITFHSRVNRFHMEKALKQAKKKKVK